LDLGLTKDLRAAASAAPDPRGQVSAELVPERTIVGGLQQRIQRGVYAVRADGSRSRRLIRGQAFRPIWSPDGERIAFIRGPSIMVMRRDGSGLRRRYTARDTGFRFPLHRL